MVHFFKNKKVEETVTLTDEQEEDLLLKWYLSIFDKVYQESITLSDLAKAFYLEIKDKKPPLELNLQYTSVYDYIELNYKPQLPFNYKITKKDDVWEEHHCSCYNGFCNIFFDPIIEVGDISIRAGINRGRNKCFQIVLPCPLCKQILYSSPCYGLGGIGKQLLYFTEETDHSCPVARKQRIDKIVTEILELFGGENAS